MAVGKAGGQPTATQVREVVFEILAPEAPQEICSTRTQQRLDLIGRLKAAIKHRKSWVEAEKLMTELEVLL